MWNLCISIDIYTQCTIEIYNSIVVLTTNCVYYALRVEIFDRWIFIRMATEVICFQLLVLYNNFDSLDCIHHIKW